MVEKGSKFFFGVFSKELESFTIKEGVRDITITLINVVVLQESQTLIYTIKQDRPVLQTTFSRIDQVYSSCINSFIFTIKQKKVNQFEDLKFILADRNLTALNYFNSIKIDYQKIIEQDYEYIYKIYERKNFKLVCNLTNNIYWYLNNQVYSYYAFGYNNRHLGIWTGQKIIPQPTKMGTSQETRTFALNKEVGYYHEGNSLFKCEIGKKSKQA